MEYLGGDIQATNMEEQGIFINICARLWDKNGYISSDIDILSQLLKVEKVALISAIKTLEELKVLKRNKNTFFVSFVLKELKEAKTTHKKRVNAGRKGGEAKALCQPPPTKARLKQSSSNAKAMLKLSSSNIEGDIEEDIEGDIDKEKNIKKRKNFEKPKPEEITEYAKSIGFYLNGSAFYDYYEARGWQYKNGQPMKDWQAAIRTWKTNEKKKEQSNRWVKEE